MIGRKRLMIVLAAIHFNMILTFGQSVSGRLMDKISGEPVAATQLTLANTDLVVFTNALGRFTFTEVPKGKYILQADINGEAMDITQVAVNGKAVDLGDLTIDKPSVSDAEAITIIDVGDLSAIENENDNFSSALSAGRDVFLNAATFNLAGGRFRPRGYFNEDSDVYLNGMLMNDQDDGRVLWTGWYGLNDVMRNRSNLLNLADNDFTFGGIGGASFVDLRASSQRAQKAITYTNSNRTFQHRIGGTWSTGMMKNGWAFSVSGSHTYGTQGFIKGTGIQATSYFVSVDRKIGSRHMLNAVVFGSPLRRGRSTGSVQEMYDLAGTNFYNPNWGYQNGEVRSAREYLINQPVAMLRHDWKISTTTNVLTTVGYQWGRFGSTRLDWYDAPDPRPDYYRNLPSYATTQEAKDLVTAFLTANEANRQLDWQSLYNANETRNYTIRDANGIPGNNVTGKLAAYVLESENYDNSKASINSVLNTKIGSRTFFTGGIQYLHEKVHYYRKLEDLLGADFYIDFNRFALRDFPENPDAGQNDVNKPNRLLKEGDVYGHNYDIVTGRGSAWGQLVFKTDRFDYFAAISLATQSFYRNGYTKVGLFPDDSYGKSDVHRFTNLGTKGGITYKIDGRNYIVLNGSYRTRAPFANESFVSPRVRDQVVNNLGNEKITAFDLSYLARFTRLKARLTGFYTYFQNKLSSDVFYHEEFRTFVNYIQTGINRKHLGVELGLEYNLNSRIILNAAGSVGDYFYTSRPVASISRDNSAEDFVQGRTIYINNYYFPGSPQVAGTVGIRYSGVKFWWAGLNVNGFAKNYLSFNPDRRTAEAVANVDPATETDLYNKIIDEEKLPDAITVDASLGKSLRMKSGALIRINLNVGNILNKRNFKTGGFEQLRYDFETNNVDKFPPRYFYSFGMNYNLGVTYIFPR